MSCVLYTFSWMAALALGTVAQHDSTQRLNKPALVSNLDYAEAGLVQHLPETSYTKDIWGAGWIPSECKYIVTGNVLSSVKFNAADVEVWNIHYSDCGDAWVFCHHKSSPVTIDSMARQFSKLPIQMRQYVRHVIDVPGDGGFAFEYDGTITFVGPIDNMVTVFVHETGHSLDLNNAYISKPLSTSDKWYNNYNQDANVPDPYSQTNFREDVAQNTVLAVYNENCPGGYGVIERHYSKVFHQYATIIDEARRAGVGNSLITHGEGRSCSHRLANSAPVLKSGKRATRKEMRSMPDVSLSPEVKVLLSKREGAAKHSNCTLTF